MATFTTLAQQVFTALLIITPNYPESLNYTVSCHHETTLTAINTKEGQILNYNLYPITIHPQQKDDTCNRKFQTKYFNPKNKKKIIKELIKFLNK